VIVAETANVDGEGGAVEYQVAIYLVRRVHLVFEI
jgi:hypothetical protein